MTYSEKICFTTNSHVVNRKVKSYWPMLKAICLMYLARGLKIVKVRADLEFLPLQELVKELPTSLEIEFVAQGMHVGPVKRNIRYGKEKVRSLRYNIPFEKIPKPILVHMIFNVTMVMNMFPRKGGNSIYSPQMIMTGRIITIDDLRIPFVSYVQFTSATTPHNSLEPRTRGAIALGMIVNNRGGRVLMALDTGKLVRKAHCKVIPMRQEVIDRVNYLGRGEKSLLIFHNKRGEEIGERSVLDRVIEADTNEPIEHDMLDVGNDTNLDVVDDVAGVDNPYEEYVDEWNKDVPEDGDDIIDQVAGNNDNSDAGVPEQLEPINNDSDTVLGRKLL